MLDDEYSKQHKRLINEHVINGNEKKKTKFVHNHWFHVCFNMNGTLLFPQGQNEKINQNKFIHFANPAKFEHIFVCVSIFFEKRSVERLDGNDNLFFFSSYSRTKIAIAFLQKKNGLITTFSYLLFLFLFFYSFAFLLGSVDKKPKPENVDIYTMKFTSDRRCKVIKLTLADVWKQGCIIRINNFGDKEKAPHSEKDIKNQVNICH